MNYMDLIIDLHKHNPRQGPGSVEESLRAFDTTKLGRDKAIKMLDIGCGTGAASIPIAQHTSAHITALDLSEEFLSELASRADSSGLTNRISRYRGDMKNLPYGDDEFDLIWCEASIYNIGFEEGLKYWRNLVKPGGYMVISEMTWLNKIRPIDLKDFPQKVYHDIAKISEKITIIENAGLSPKAHFVIDETSWLENYYNKLESQYESFAARHGSSKEAKQVIEEHKVESELYKKYKEFFGYTFFIMQK